MRRRMEKECLVCDGEWGECGDSVRLYKLGQIPVIV